MSKETQEVVDRLFESFRKEWEASNLDMLLYGTGFLKVTMDGVEHIPFEVVQSDMFHDHINQIQVCKEKK